MAVNIPPRHREQARMQARKYRCNIYVYSADPESEDLPTARDKACYRRTPPMGGVAYIVDMRGDASLYVDCD